MTISELIDRKSQDQAAELGGQGINAKMHAIPKFFRGALQAFDDALDLGSLGPNRVQSIVLGVARSADDQQTKHQQPQTRHRQAGTVAVDPDHCHFLEQIFRATRVTRLTPDFGSTPPCPVYQLLAPDRLHVIDVARGWEGRGFDVRGRRSWIDHPRARSDIILTVRRDLDPQERALKVGPGPFYSINPAII